MIQFRDLFKNRYVKIDKKYQLKKMKQNVHRYYIHLLILKIVYYI